MNAILGTLLLALVVSASTSGQLQAPVSIAGRFVDHSSAELPGVTVTFTDGVVTHKVVTDHRGRFRVDGLVLGTYDLEAFLPGFVTARRSVILAGDVRRAYLEWPMELACVEQVQRVMSGPLDMAAKAEAILHVRVTSENGRMSWHEAGFCKPVLLRAYGIGVVGEVPRPGAIDNARVDEMLTQPFEEGLLVGSEYIVMLVPGGHVTDGLIFPIVEGRVGGRAGEPLVGLTTREALDQLARWAEGR